jgi:hypothetical protein
MQNDDIFYPELVKQDYTDHNLRVVKHCIKQTRQAVLEQTADYPARHRIASIKGYLGWDLLDHFLDQAAINQLFEGITSKWITHEGAEMLELHGKNTILTAKHVETKDEEIADTENGYRKNAKINNQKNQLLLKELAEPISESVKPKIFLVHGHGFAYLRILLEKSDVPELTSNIMLMPDLDAASETEFVPEYKPEMLPQKVASEPEVLPKLSLKKNENDHSKS